MTMIINHYELNVSLNGRHLFATDARSVSTSEEARRLYTEFTKRFPESEGFKVSVTRVECSGSTVNWEVR